MKLLLIALLCLSTVASFAQAQSGGRYKQDFEEADNKWNEMVNSAANETDLELAEEIADFYDAGNEMADLVLENLEENNICHKLVLHAVELYTLRNKLKAHQISKKKKINNALKKIRDLEEAHQCNL